LNKLVVKVLALGRHRAGDDQSRPCETRGRARDLGNPTGKGAESVPHPTLKYQRVRRLPGPQPDLGEPRITAKG
jgi:hypothetical protein